MADNSDTPTPAKATAGTRRTMAPTARRPLGADDLAALSDRELDDLERAVRAARMDRARHPRPPSFGMSEGERAELEMNGKTISPWNGEEITGDGSPRTAAE